SAGSKRLTASAMMSAQSGLGTLTTITLGWRSRTARPLRLRAASNERRARADLALSLGGEVSDVSFLASVSVASSMSSGSIRLNMTKLSWGGSAHGQPIR